MCNWIGHVKFFLVINMAKISQIIAYTMQQKLKSPREEAFVKLNFYTLAAFACALVPIDKLCSNDLSARRITCLSDVP